MSRDIRTDTYIQALPVWQQTVLQEIRNLIHEAEPKMEETIKRTTQPFFVLKGNVCAFQAAKDHVNISIYDPLAPDPQHLLNQGLGNKTARAIQLYQGDKINHEAFKNLIRAVVKNNQSGGWRKLPQ